VEVKIEGVILATIIEVVIETTEVAVVTDMLPTEVVIETTEVVVVEADMETTEVVTETTEVVVVEADMEPTEVVIKTTAAEVKAVGGEVSKVKVTKRVASKIKNSKAVEVAQNQALSQEEVPLISN
jgi:hypothetical protein